MKWKMMGMQAFLCASLLHCVCADHVDADTSGTWDFIYTHLMLLWINRFCIYSCAAVGIALWICSHFISRKSKEPKYSSQNGSPVLQTEKLEKENHCSPKEIFVSGVKIFYGSQTGTAKGFAHLLAEDITGLGLPTDIINLMEYDPDDHLAEEARTGKFPSLSRWLDMFLQRINTILGLAVYANTPCRGTFLCELHISCLTPNSFTLCLLN